MAKRNDSLTIHITTVFRTERIEINRVVSRKSFDYSLFVDAEYQGSFKTQSAAEHAGAMLLEDEMRRAA